MSANNVPTTVSGEEYICNLARYIRSHSEQLSAPAGALRSDGRHDARSTWSSMLYLSAQAPKPVTLTLDLYHLYYVLLKIQEAGFADVGDMDEPLRLDHHRRPPVPAASLARFDDKADTLSIKSSFSTISKGLSSIGSGWWGASTSTNANDAATALARDLKLIYTAFTLLPSLRIVRLDPKGKGKAIEGFDFPDLPGDRMVPLKSFKSLERLELEGIDARVLLFSDEWSSMVHLRVNDCGLESVAEILSTCKRRKDDDLKWAARLRIIDFESNDITGVDGEETKGMERVLSLSLRRNLLVSVPTAMASMTCLRALDLSENMIDSVLAIYSSLPGLQILNLSGNRISSLCGLERLLSLEKLDIRHNQIHDAAEILRLVTLPHLTDLWIGEGNPFLDDLTSHRGHGWRVRFFDGYLRVPDKARRQLVELPRLDGSQPSWNEQRHLSHIHKYDERKVKEAASLRETATWPSNSRMVPDLGVDSPVKTLQSRRSRNLSENAACRVDEVSLSPPLPPPMQESRDKNPADRVTGTQSSTSQAPANNSTVAKTVKRKHRRIIDLDRPEGTVLPEQDKAAERNRHRAQSVPAGTSRVSGQGEDTHRDIHKKSTLSTKAAASKKVVNSRALKSNTFQDPALEAVQGSQTDSGSDAEDFRRKMEKLRNEVGATNWLSVYANTVHARQAEGGSADA